MLNELLFQIVLFLANIMQTITGFAGTLLAMPFSIRLVGVEEAKVVLNIFTMLACLVITVQNRRYINHRSLAQMVCGMAVGMAAGVWLFERIPLTILLQLYAVLVIAVAVKKMFWKKQIALPKAAMVFVLAAAGIIHGMFLSGGALLVIYAVSVLKDKNEFRATVAPVWVILNACLMVSHYRAGYYTAQCLRAVGMSIVPLILSVIVGNMLYKRINQEQFLKITYVLLLISGASLLV